jgi:DNA topoisomerase I
MNTIIPLKLNFLFRYQTFDIPGASNKIINKTNPIIEPINGINIYNNKYNNKIYMNKLSYCDYEIEDETSRQSFDQKNFTNGICRKKIGNKFKYVYIKNGNVINKSDEERIKKLKIPPAWTNVWISINENEPIQAIGMDIGGKKQYRYHETHIQKAEMEKFIRLYDFINSIPKLEKAIEIDMKKDTYNREKVITTMLIIVKAVHMRVGKECYAQTNKSYGISSLKKNHVKIELDKISFDFKGKSNKRLHYSMINNHVAKHINELLRLPDEKLFQYYDNDNNLRRVTDTDLNQYIQQKMGNQFTCKDFRTYAANNYFIESILRETNNRLPKDGKTIKKNILLALKRTAYYLKHTKAISKKSYVMNFAIDMYQRNPNFFIERKDKSTNDVLLEILKIYKENVMNE